jgi:hypothetical protein
MNEQLPVQLSFDVSLPERAQRIRNLVSVARGCIIEIGRELIAAKAEVAHGGWLPWIEEEFGWGHATASNYMNVATKFPTLGSSAGLTIDATALYALSAPAVPQEARDWAVEAAEDGDRVTLVQAEAMIADALQAERAKFEAMVEALQAEAEEDDPGGGHSVAELIQRLCEATNRKRLKPAQYQHLACILGTAITDGMDLGIGDARDVRSRSSAIVVVDRRDEAGDFRLELRRYRHRWRPHTSPPPLDHPAPAHL